MPWLGKPAVFSPEMAQSSTNSAQQITKNETIKYSLGMMLAFATAGLGAGELLPNCDAGVFDVGDPLMVLMQLRLLAARLFR